MCPKTCAAPDVEIISPLLSNDCSTPFDKKVFATIPECFTHDEFLIGVLELTDTPNFDDVVAKLPATKKILLAPMLFNGGIHLTQDRKDMIPLC